MKRARRLFFVLVVLLVCILAACATNTTSPPPSGGGEGTTTNAQELAVWSMDSDCLECHQNEAESDANSQCMSLMHASEVCTSCHTDEKERLAAAHKDYDSGIIAIKLKKTKVARDTCLSCHNSDDLVESQASSTVLTDFYGEVVNPHDVIANDDHNRDLECGACHKMHLEQSASEIAPDVCERCHHYNVYTCHPCHNPITGEGINA